MEWFPSDALASETTTQILHLSFDSTFFTVGNISRLPMKIKELLLLFAGPAVLCSVALSQHYMVRVHHLNPWERGGFAMFATVDKSKVRSLKIVFTLASNAKFAGAHPRNYDDQVMRLLHMPSRRELVRLAQSLADEMWVDFREQGAPGQKPTKYAEFYKGTKRADSSVKVKAVELTVYEYQYDAQSNQLTGRPLQDSGLVEAR